VPSSSRVASPELAAAAEVAGDEREQSSDLGERDECEDVVGLGLPRELAEIVRADLGIGIAQSRANASMVRSSSQRKYGRPLASIKRSGGVGASKDMLTLRYLCHWRGSERPKILGNIL
jgi:hypothetical protein